MASLVDQIAVVPRLGSAGGELEAAQLLLGQ
jgi:hypothetical protein